MSGGYNPACNTHGLVSMKRECIVLLEGKIEMASKIKGLCASSLTAAHMGTLLQGLDAEKFTEADARPGSSAVAKKRNYGAAVDEVKTETERKLRKVKDDAEKEEDEEAQQDDQQNDP
jgi:hypothetical protein